MEAPINSAFLTKYSSEIDDAWLYTSRVYHGHHIIVTASMEFIMFGSRIEATHSARIRDGTERNTSEILMITASILVP